MSILEIEVDKAKDILNNEKGYLTPKVDIRGTIIKESKEEAGDNVILKK